MYFYTNDHTWIHVASMKETRLRAACTVFEERVVISGGYNSIRTLKTVEAYYHIAIEWSYMPSMIKAKYYHKLVTDKNNFFTVGRELVGMYDSSCKFLLPSRSQIGMNITHLVC